MSKPNKPSGNQGRRSQNSNKKPGGKERIDATVASASTVPAPAEIVPAPAEIVSASVDTIPAPAEFVSASVDTIPASVDTVSAPVDTVPTPVKTVSAPAKTASGSAKTVPAPASAVSAPTNAVPAPTSTFSSGLQTIAAAYGDYTKKSFEDTKCFVEKLASVRSLDKAFEVQAEYAKTTYETFVAESQKIRGLYSDLARQSFKPFEGFAPKSSRAVR
jgi:hypothetical protein